jgi:hypothetical protein
MENKPELDFIAIGDTVIDAFISVRVRSAARVRFVLPMFVIAGVDTPQLGEPGAQSGSNVAPGEYTVAFAICAKEKTKKLKSIILENKFLK